MFEKDQKNFRQINPYYFEEYQQVLDSGLYDELISEKLLIPHQEVENSDICKTLELERIPFISYPYEWAFSQIKDAALLTLKIQKSPEKRGFLKGCQYL